MQLFKKYLDDERKNAFATDRQVNTRTNLCQQHVIRVLCARCLHVCIVPILSSTFFTKFSQGVRIGEILC